MMPLRTFHSYRRPGQHQYMRSTPVQRWEQGNRELMCQKRAHKHSGDWHANTWLSGDGRAGGSAGCWSRNRISNCNRRRHIRWNESDRGVDKEDREEHKRPKHKQKLVCAQAATFDSIPTRSSVQKEGSNINQKFSWGYPFCQEEMVQDSTVYPAWHRQWANCKGAVYQGKGKSVSSGRVWPPRASCALMVGSITRWFSYRPCCQPTTRAPGN